MIDFSKMEGHTPGPWEKYVGCGRVVLPTGEHAPTPPCDGMLDGESWLDMRRRTDPDREAFKREENANRLLANSAPAMKDEIIRQRAVIDELVEALGAAKEQLGLNMIGQGEQYCDAYDKADSAVKKAKGNE